MFEGKERAEFENLQLIKEVALLRTKFPQNELQKLYKNEGKDIIKLDYSQVSPLAKLNASSLGRCKVLE
jgi:hypothetical protein